MKKVVTEIPQEFVTSGGLTGREIVVYRSKNSENYCILSKLVQVNTVLLKSPRKPTNYKYMESGDTAYQYGFIPFSGFENPPRYVGNTAQESIEQVIKAGREVYAFDSMKEMLRSLNNKVI